MNGVEGYKFTSKINGNGIFLPAGNRWNESRYNYGSCGYFWSSTQLPSHSHLACSLDFGSGYEIWIDINYRSRFWGLTVRPVTPNIHH